MTPAETDSISNFIKERTSWVQGEPKPNDVKVTGRVRLLVHVVPTTFNERHILNKAQMKGFDWIAPQRAHNGDLGNIHNGSGYLAHSSRCYLLLFYTGAVEGLLTFLAEPIKQLRCINGTALETDVLKTIERAVNALRKCGIKSPLSVHLDLGPLKGIGVAPATG